MEIYPTAIKRYGGRKYVFNGYYHIPYGQKVKGICDLFAVRNIHSGIVHHWFYDWKNSFIVTEVLEKLLKIYPDKYVYIIWDGWSAHTSGHTQVFIDLHPTIKILALPTRAFWLNSIERDFGTIQRFLLNNSDFKSVTPRVLHQECYTKSVTPRVLHQECYIKSVTQAMDRIGNFIEKELCSNGMCN